MTMGRTGRTAVALMIALTVATSAAAQRLSIGQVDTGRLLIGQRVDLFVSIDTPDGAEPRLDELAVYESADGSVYREVDAIYDLASIRSLDAPLAFYVLVDNSGSMYEETVPGSDEVRRIDAARDAIRDFANSITNERDRIGLAVFNTGYRELTPPSTDKAQVGELLATIEQPAREEAYTELYAALVASASDATAVGRRTVVVLSDGENYPYSVYENDPHPVHGERLYDHEDAIEAFQREGLSLFAIHYGDREDPNLGAIAERTGGAVYRARGPEELAQVYREIRSELLDEYRLSYRATTIPAERRFVRVVYERGGTTLTAERPYFANTLFGGAGEAAPGVLLGSLIVGVVLLAALLVLIIRGGSKQTSLVVLDSGGVKGLEKTVALGGGDTVIGASQEADVTIADKPSIGERHAVVTYEEKSSQYTIVSDAPVRVNNQRTTKRVLKPGDVINVEGTIFAFDEPQEEDRPDTRRE